MATLATSEPGCSVRKKEAWPSEGPRGTLAGVSTQTLSRQRWKVMASGPSVTIPNKSRPLPACLRSDTESGGGRARERETAGCHPWVWVFCWFPSSSNVASPLSAQPSGPGRDQKIPCRVEGEATWKVCAQCCGCCAGRAKHLAGGEGGFWKASWRRRISNWARISNREVHMTGRRGGVINPACEGPNGVRASCVVWARGRGGGRCGGRWLGS